MRFFLFSLYLAFCCCVFTLRNPQVSEQQVDEVILSLGLPPTEAALARNAVLSYMEASSRACFDTFCHDPDCGKNVTELIKTKGYVCEDYYALTPDGYFLSMQRIPYGLGGPSTRNTTLPPVLLQHGLLDASHTWVINLPHESLGFILADAGFDVWLGNNRGNTYSDLNIYYTIDESDFWQFDWDEMANSDLPTQIDFVIKNTGYDQIYYIGHSEGTTQAFSGFTNPTTASKVKLFVALAPVAYTGKISSVFIQTIAALHVDVILKMLGFNHFLIDSCWMNNIVDFTCEIDNAAFCQIAMCAIMGCNPSNLNTTRYEIYGQLDPAGTSVQNMNHWGQMTRKDNYCMYDFGTRHKNEKHYNQAHPPCYDIGKMSVPVALFSGGKDKLADPTDVQRTISELNPSVIAYNVAIPYYEHLDFVWGLDAYQVLYPQVVSLLNKFA